MARADAAKIEAQHYGARRAQSAGQTVNHLVVHRAAELRMRVAEDDREPRRLVLGLFEERFGGALEGPGRKWDSDAARHMGSTLCPFG